MTSTPFLPSTIESRVRAATTPCRPGTYAFAIALKASAVPSAGARVLSRGRGSLARCTLPVPEHVRWPRPSGTGPRGRGSSRETRFPVPPALPRSTGKLSEREGERVGGEGGVVDGRGLPRDDVLGAWPHRDLADGADGVAAPLRQRLDREDHLARACEGVRARGHRGRARVVRAAAHGHAAVEDPDDVAHQAEWEPAVGE